VRNYNSSAWLETPGLVEIKAVTASGRKQNVFTLTVKLKAPQTADGDDVPKDKAEKGTKP
jgi:type IV pilus assembly protein PilN